MSLPKPVSTVPHTPFDAPAGSWTLVVLPDTQHYPADHPEVLERITEWVAAHRDSHHILFVAHEGDVVENNVHPQWMRVHHAYEKLVRAGIPYSLALGNHDLEGDCGKPVSRFSLLNEYFTIRDYRHCEDRGIFEPCHLENSWQEFSTPTGKFLVLCLEYAPRDAVLEWANTVAASHPESHVVVMVHEYLFFDATRFDWEVYGTHQEGANQYPFFRHGDLNDGERIWRKFVSRHANIHFVLCGHVERVGASHLASPGAGGQPVHQILANYTHISKAFGGGGVIRLLRFLPGGGEVQIRTYSPWYDQWQNEPAHCFNVSLHATATA